MTPSPLHLRLPSPPRPFFGREAALARLAAAEGGGARVLVVAGGLGVGKSAVVVAHLEQAHPDAAVIFVDFAGIGPGVDAVGVVSRALLEAAPERAPVAASNAGHSVDERVATLLDAAERGQRALVLDGLERAHANASTLLDALGRHARQSRWWCTTRTLRPAAGPTLVTLPLEPLGDDELRVMAAHLAQSRSLGGRDPERAVAAAAGSPWRLLAGLTGHAAEPSGLGRLVEPEVAPLVGLLTACERPVPRAVAQRIASADRARSEAVALGLLREVEGGAMVLDEPVRAWARAAVDRATERDLEARLSAWRHDPEPTSQLEALALALRLGAMAEARALLDTSGGRMLSAGLGFQLWPLLEPLTDRLVVDWRDVVAVDVGALEALDADAVKDIMLRCARAKLLGLRGLFAESFACAQSAYDDAVAAQDVVAQVHAALVLAPSLLNAGEPARAAALLADLRADTLHESLGLLAYRANALALLGQEDTAGALLREALEPLSATLASVPMSVRHRLAGACYAMDERGWVRRLLAPELAGALPPSLVPIRFALIHGALSAIDDGRLAEAESLIGRLMSGHDDGVVSYADYHEVVVALELSLARGSMLAAQATLASLPPAPRRPIDEEHLIAVRSQLAIAFGTPPADGPPPDLDDVVPAYVIDVARHRVRHDAAASWPALPRWTTTNRRARHMLPLRLQAEVALLRGDPESALQSAEHALREARRAGFRIIEGEIVGLLADIHAVAGRWPEVSAAAQALAELATATGSLRLAADASFRLAFSGGGALIDWAALDRVAATLDPSPAAARRARALLAWQGVPLDRLDTLVLAAVRRDHASTAGRVVARGDATAEPRWGLDLSRRDAWSVAAGWLSLPEDGVSWRLLERLTSGDGWADNESLVGAVWGVQGYRPHLHDNRLHVAVYKVRRALTGTGTEAADHILRDGDGYGLAGRCLVVRAT